MIIFANNIKWYLQEDNLKKKKKEKKRRKRKKQKNIKWSYEGIGIFSLSKNVSLSTFVSIKLFFIYSSFYNLISKITTLVSATRNKNSTRLQKLTPSFLIYTRTAKTWMKKQIVKKKKKYEAFSTTLKHNNVLEKLNFEKYFTKLFVIFQKTRITNLIYEKDFLIKSINFVKIRNSFINFKFYLKLRSFSLLFSFLKL